MFDGHYDNWTQSRMNCIHKYVIQDYFKSKTLLELGGGHANNGNEFSKLGAIVTSSDARKKYLNYVNKIYPHIHTLIIECDNTKLENKYDVILHWGLLYHLDNIDSHLENVLQNCDVLILETEVSDSDKDNVCIKIKENGYDQAFNAVGSRPSASYVEKILEKNGFFFKIIKDSILNSSFHKYDWDIKNTNTWASGLRRFWICWKNVKSPLIIDT